MIQVRLFGGVVVRRDGDLLTGRATQRHPLAIIAFLAVAPGRSATRDKLIAHLWPDSDGPRARHRLSVALHVLRRGLGEGCLTTVGDSVALGPGVETDVGAFMDAIADGRLEDAVAIYQGPFLDGFFVGGVKEHEHWIDAERERLSAHYRAALERLIAESEAAGDLIAARAWWQALARHEPYSSAVAMGVLRALAAVGDVAGVLRHARAYATLVRGELDMAPNPAVLELAHELTSVPDDVARDGRESESRREPPSRSPSGSGPTEQGRAVDVPAPERERRGRLGARVGLASALAVVGAALAWGLALRQPEAGPLSGPGIAVLPFADESVPIEHRELASGLAEDVRAALSFVPGLRVAPAEASTRSGGGGPVEIGRRLQVATVVEGSVRSVDDSVLVVVRLWDTRSRQERWTGSYLRRAGDPVGVRDEISFTIADELRLHAAPFEPKQYTESRRAYDLFLQGVYAHRRVTEQDVWVALQFYREAYEEDPSFALAHAVAGNAYVTLTGRGLSPEVGFARAREHVLEALALDSTLAEGHAALGYLQIWGDEDFEAGKRSLRRAIMLYPTLPQARHWYGSYALLIRGWLDTGVANVQRAFEVDPLNTARSNVVEWALYLARRYEEVLAQRDVTWALDPEVARSRRQTFAGEAYRELGRYEEALEEFHALHERVGGLPPAGLGVTYARMGREAEARALLGEWQAQADQPGADLSIAALHVALGDHAAALRWIERAYEARTSGIFSLGVDPVFDPLRSSSRFQELVSLLGITDIAGTVGM